jgi:hypothetical protein
LLAGFWLTAGEKNASTKSSASAIVICREIRRERRMGEKYLRNP